MSSPAAPPGLLSKPLPDPPDLPYPPLAALIAATAGAPPTSDLALDARSLEHLADILRQSFANVKLQDEVWLAPFLAALTALSDYLAPDILAAVVESRIAECKASDRADRKPAGKPSKKGKERDKSTGDFDAADGERRNRAAEERRARWSDARELLGRSAGAREPASASTSTPSHVPEVEDASKDALCDQVAQSLGTRLDDTPRLALFRLALRTIETTPKAIRTNHELKLGLVFSPDDWNAKDAATVRPLFGRDGWPQEPEDAESKAVQLFGGTLELTAYAKDLPKLTRVLELGAFATLSLKLEAHLLRDLACPRPLFDSDVGAQSDAASSHGDTAPPTPSILAPNVEQDVDPPPPPPPPPGASPKKGHQSKWSSSNFWGILRGSTPSSPSLATSFRSTDLPSASTTPTGSKVRDRLKGLGGLKLRKSRRGRRDASDASSRPSMDLEALENWDLVGGLGLTGLESLDYSGLPPIEDLMSKEGDEADDRATGGEQSSQGSTDASEVPPAERFQKVINKMEACILSCSPNVIFPPPHLLVRLRKQEIAQLQLATSTPALNLNSVETIPALPPKPAPFLSPLGWPARPPVERLRSYTTIDARTLALGFASGHSALPEPAAAPSGAHFGTVTSTTSQATRITLDARAGLASLMTNNNSLSGTIRHQGMHFLVETACKDAEPNVQSCKLPQWLTFDYWEDSADRASETKEDRPDSTLGQLLERLVAGQDVACDGCKRPGREHCSYWMHNKERISVSVSAHPAAPTVPEQPNDSTRPRIGAWTTCRTCHAQTPVTALSAAAYAFSFAKYAELMLYNSEFVPLPELCVHASNDRNALVRSFSLGSTVVSLAVDQIELFELRLPTSVDPLVAPPAAAADDLTSIGQLRSEIESFYVSVRDRLDFLEDLIPLASTIKKASPALAKSHAKGESESTVHEAEDDADLAAGGTIKAGAPFRLVGALRELVNADEASLLADGLADVTSPSLLNIGRFEFVRRAKAVKARLAAWELKHAATLEADAAGPLPPPVYAQPDYFLPEVHVLPIESSVLVRESELSSAIALTLSAPAFQAEVSALSAFATRKPPSTSYFDTPHLSTSRHTPSRHPIPTSFLDPAIDSTAAAGTSPKSPRLPLSPRAKPSLDPDDSTCDFSLDESWSGEAKPKKEGRTGSVLLNIASIRGGLAHKKSTESGFNFFGRASPLPTPTEGPSLNPDRSPADFVLEDLVATSHPVLPSPALRALKPKASTGALPQIMTGLLAPKRTVSETTTSSVNATADMVASGPPSTAASVRSSSSSITDTSRDAEESFEALEAETDPVAPLETPQPTGSRLVNAFWNLGSIRGGRNSGLNTPNLSASEGAHIKYKFTHGDKSFRVTCWHAEKFQQLRTCCGLSEDLFIESLSRCTDLNPSGGKSKAAFWMTGDRRFMLKELVTAWGVSEKDAFLTFAPELLKHLMATERPSLLAKIFGFYTVKTKNLKTGETRRMDLIVMEHLFHAQAITRQFDLKGVAGRRVPTKKTTTSVQDPQGHETLWDEDWKSGSPQSRLLLYSHSKTLLRDALLNDSTFLAKCGNIDYSLLVGVNDTTHELVVGLIDIIGVFNLAKMLENAGKTVIKKATSAEADTVTVLPPEDYALRFRQAMETNFVSVPEKFSRGGVERAMDPDPRLASVL